MFATDAMLDGLPARVPVAVHARAGRYAFDTMTPVGPDSWTSPRAAVDCALTAVDLVVGGARAAYALCRPPGHHVTRAAYGGSCYLNNAAVAAEGLRRGGHERVAIVDIDAHYGNGTASIFYDRADVSYGSVHIDPGAGWFPHVVGFADETGSGDGAGTTLNVPLAPETGDGPWIAAVARLAEAVSRHDSTALVVSLGVDAAVDDPNSPLRITREGYGGAGDCSARSASRRSSSRKAATTCQRSAASLPQRWRRSRTDSPAGRFGDRPVARPHSFVQYWLSGAAVQSMKSHGYPQSTAATNAATSPIPRLRDSAWEMW